MRKVLLWLVAILMILVCAVAQGEGTNVYISDFTTGTNGWYGRGASVQTAAGALRTDNRQSDWNSPGRDFDLVEGCRYILSVIVSQDQAEKADFMISVAHSKDGAETYENLAKGTVTAGSSTTLTGEYVAGDFDKFVLYVETVGNPTLSYDIKDFTVVAPDGEPEAKPTEPPMVIEAVENMPSLKDTYAGKFDFGCCLNQMELRDSKLLALVKEQFSIITPENELKPDAVLDVAASKKLAAEDETAVAVHFDSAKGILDFARDNGIKVHGHVLVWHSQTPEAFFHEGYEPKNPYVSREVMLARLDNYIRLVMEYLDANYPGVVVSWDVANEVIDDGTGVLRNSNWLKVVGEDFVAQAFAMARKYAPEGTLLYLNDYNSAEAVKLKGLLALMEALIPEGNIDGYGFQMHYSAGYPSMENIANALKKVNDLGLRIRVSELDVGVDNNTEKSFNAQAEKFGRIMKQMLKYADTVEAVQVWGVTDTLSWRAKDFPLLFDGNLNPKPAFWAVIDPNTI